MIASVLLVCTYNYHPNSSSSWPVLLSSTWTLTEGFFSLWRPSALLFTHQVMSNSVTPWPVAGQASLSFAISQSLLKLMSMESVMPSNHLILSSLSPSAFHLSQHQGLFKGVSSSHQVVKVWDLSFNNSSSNEHPGLISFRMDGLDLLAAQGNLKSLLQHHSSKASILQCSAFFIV